MRLFVVLALGFFDWLGETSPKWPMLCRVGRKTTTQPISQSLYTRHAHNRLTAFGPGLPGRPVPEATLTHSHPSWSSDILYHLPPSTTIYSILCVQITCMTVLFDNLCPGPLGLGPSTSYSVHFFTHLSSFCSTCPYHRSLLCCNTNVMSSIPSLSLSQLLIWKFFFA